MEMEKKLPIWLQLTLGILIPVILINSYNFNLLGEFILFVLLGTIAYINQNKIKLFLKKLTVWKVLKWGLVILSLGVVVILGFVWYMVIGIVICMMLYHFFSRIF